MKRTLFTLAVSVGVTITAAHAASETDSAAAQADRAAIEKSTVAGKIGNGALEEITPEQRALLVEKLRLINQIMSATAPDMDAQGIGSDGRRWAVEALSKLSLRDLRNVGVPGTLAAMSAALARQDGQANTKLGQTTSELVYIPIAPCRFIDTRNVGGPISGTRAYDFDLTGSSYGGSGACNPSAAVGGNAKLIGAIAMNVTIVSPPLAPGFLGARPAGDTNTTSLVNWYEGGATVQAANAAVVTTNQGAGTNEIEFFGGPTQVIVDVFGVFAAPTATALDCATQVQHGPGNNDVLNNTFQVIGAPACPAGYTRTAVNCHEDSFGSGVYLQEASASFVDCRFFNVSGISKSSSQMAAESVCCRIPGR